MAKSKSDAAFLSLLRYEHSPELVEQIHKSRNKTYSQPHRGDKIPESAAEHSPQHQNPRSSDQHYGKTGFRHGRQQQIYCKQNIISLMLSDRIWLLIHRQQFTILKKCKNCERPCRHIGSIVEWIRRKYPEIFVFDTGEINPCRRIYHRHKKQGYRYCSSEDPRKPGFSGHSFLQLCSHMLVQHHLQSDHCSAV